MPTRRSLWDRISSLQVLAVVAALLTIVADDSFAQNNCPATFNTQNASELKIAGLPNGSAIALWTEDAAQNPNTTGSRKSIFWSLRSSGTWSTPAVLVNGQGTLNSVSASDPGIVVAPNGTVTVIWQQSLCSDFIQSLSMGNCNEAYDDYAAIRVARLPLGGTWSSPEEISAPVGDTSAVPPINVYQSPLLAVTGDGTVIAVWEVTNIYPPPHYAGETAVRFFSPLSGQWSDTTSLVGRPFDLSAAPDGHAAIAVNHAWSGVDGLALKAPDSSEWKETVLSLETFENILSVAAGNGGRFVLLSQQAGIQGPVRSSTLAAGATTWSTPVSLSDASLELFKAQVRMRANGDAVAAWVQKPNGLLATAFQPAADTSFTVVTSLAGDRPNVQVREFELAMGGDGTAGIVWSLNDNARTREQIRIQSATLPPTAAQWQEKSNLSASGRSGPVVDVDSGGAMTALWKVGEPADLAQGVETSSSDASSRCSPANDIVGALIQPTCSVKTSQKNERVLFTLLSGATSRPVKNSEVVFRAKGKNQKRFSSIGTARTNRKGTASSAVPKGLRKPETVIRADGGKCSVSAVLN